MVTSTGPNQDFSANLESPIKEEFFNAEEGPGGGQSDEFSEAIEDFDTYDSIESRKNVDLSYNNSGYVNNMPTNTKQNVNTHVCDEPRRSQFENSSPPLPNGSCSPVESCCSDTVESKSPAHPISGVGSNPEDTDDNIPVCFINGCGHDLTEARRRWQITKKWRKDNNVDGILWEPQPNFAMIKSLYPHAVHKKSNSGHWIYIERPGLAKLSKVWKCGLTMADLERHYTFITEYLFRKIEEREDAQIISIFDATGCKLTDLAGNTLKMFQRCSALVGAHYPERSHKIFIINAPFWMSAAWNILAPFLDPNTKKKIVISKTNHRQYISEYCDLAIIPEIIGGSDKCLFGQSPAELEMLEWVTYYNSKAGYPTSPDFCLPTKPNGSNVSPESTENATSPTA